MGFGPHAAFIVSAYAIVAVCLAGLTGWLLADARRQRRLLRDLDARGVIRRSAGTGVVEVRPEVEQ